MPAAAAGASFQQNVSHMNVASNVVADRTGVATGNIEFWPTNYARTNSAAVPGASDSAYDYGDDPRPGGYGSMQVHDHGAGETILAYNRWGASGTSNSDLGIGNRPSGEPDWTFAQNANGYTIKNLYVPGIVTGTGLATGNIEFWANHYGGGNEAGVPGANGGRYDFGDDVNEGVPVGLVPIGWGGTSVAQWLPGAAGPDSAPLYDRLEAALDQLGPEGFRAIFWHQGESDAGQGTSEADYAQRLADLIAASRADGGWEIPWLVALASYRPGTGPDLDVLGGQWSVIQNDPLVFLGAMTDDMIVPYRNGATYGGIHFNEVGLIEHG